MDRVTKALLAAILATLLALLFRQSPPPPPAYAQRQPTIGTSAGDMGRASGFSAALATKVIGEDRLWVYEQGTLYLFRYDGTRSSRRIVREAHVVVRQSTTGP